MIRILLIFLSLSFGFSQEYTINGYVKDASSSEDLIAVNIYVEGQLIGTKTNEYGYYALTLESGSFVLIYDYVGYDKKKVPIDLTEDMTINVELAYEVLGEDVVEVVGEREDRNVSSIEMSVAQIDMSAVKKAPVVLGEADPIKSLKLLPGVTSSNAASNGFSIRGGAPDQNLILLDEAVIYNASHLFGFFSIFNADAIKDFKLYKGGINAKYGGRLSSVLDIRQKEGNKKESDFNAGIGLVSSRLVAEGPIFDGKGSYLFAGRRSYADVFLAFTENKNTAFFYDLNLKANYEVNDQNRFFLSGYFGRDSFVFDELFGNTWGNTAITARWNHVFNRKLFANTSVIYSDYNYESKFYAVSDYKWISFVRNINYKTDFTYFINNLNRLEFGVNAINYQFNPGEITPINGSNINPLILDNKYAFEPSVYLSYTQQLTTNLRLKYGLRYSAFFRQGNQDIRKYKNNQAVVYNNALGRYENGEVLSTKNYSNNETISRFDAFEPRFGLTYALSDASSLKLSYNRTKQYVSLITNSSSSSPLDIWAPSGPFIKPQMADQIALGYFQNFKDNSYEFSIESYYKTLENQMDFVPGADLQQNNNLETEILTGDGRAYGIELLFRKTKGRLSGWLAYTYSRSERRIPGITKDDPGINNGEYYPGAYDKPHNFSITASYDFNEDWIFSTNIIASSGRPTTYPVSRYILDGAVVTQYESVNRDRLPMESRLDLGATLKNKWGGDWVFSLYNVLNIKNTAYLRFRQVKDTLYDTEAVKFSFFGVVPSITYNFKL